MAETLRCPQCRPPPTVREICAVALTAMRHSFVDECVAAVLQQRFVHIGPRLGALLGMGRYGRDRVAALVAIFASELDLRRQQAMRDAVIYGACFRD